MTKMGRPPKDESSKKTAHLSVRISTSLRNRLEQARLEEGGRSLSEEVEIRLRESFEINKSIDDLFGGKETRRILQIIAEQIEAIEGATGERIYDPEKPRNPARPRWFKDPFVYGQVRLMIDTIFQYLKPAGRRVIPKHVLLHPSLKKEAENMGKHHAVQALARIQAARDQGRETDQPIQYRRAARVLGSQLKGSPIKKYLKNQQRHMKQYFAKGRDYDK
jgi:hypothetical protein